MVKLVQDSSVIVLCTGHRGILENERRHARGGRVADRASYESAVLGLRNFGEALEALIRQILRSADVNVLDVNYRVKDFDSASRKLQDGAKKYQDYGDLTDLLGIRIITFFAEQVDHVADVLRPAFLVDPENSTDKRALMDPDRFGYLSLHFVAGLSRERLSFPENAGFHGKRFELQIRSILQHAWAENEHDLGYKSRVAIPKVVRRRFSRLAGLLELADAEFDAIRRDLVAYAEEVSTHLAEPGESAGNSTLGMIEVDQDSLVQLIATDPFIATLDHQIGHETMVSVLQDPSPRGLNYLTEIMLAFGVFYIDDLRDILRVQRRHVLRFAELWIGPVDVVARIQAGPGYDPVDRGISIFYLAYVLLSQIPSKRAEDVINRRFLDDGAVVVRAKAVWSEVVEELGMPAPPNPRSLSDGDL